MCRTAFRIAAYDYKMAEVDICVVTADRATYQPRVRVCVFVCCQLIRRNVDRLFQTESEKLYFVVLNSPKPQLC